MLQIKTGLKKGDGVTVVLDNMNEIVGRYVSDDESTLVLTCVRVIVPQANAQGGVGISLHPLCYSSEEAQKGEMTFSKDKIITFLPAMENVTQSLRQEDTGIVGAN